MIEDRVSRWAVSGTSRVAMGSSGVHFCAIDCTEFLQSIAHCQSFFYQCVFPLCYHWITAPPPVAQGGSKARRGSRDDQ
jgi:hypothetical protein